ncbi:putative 3-oxoacyl-[acyl-carrier-protein] reductase [Venustampulla echinocandica]|uniref:Putative 3-oxoacyl-[acyl-carrier-protein] reductase n=1 Tax=Venustampulla echinocandica TaxID=2656787 RepID=A0A370TYS0_9HELO|nr:putative 3-oxoacyl-[acyl-carrier-protein] reductase [Venustampulla echinocandica]RDL40677.1 putative 3-oxoacyl-[acyl-carrier-protein] reductase [Venustampulla echinocandica]
MSLQGKIIAITGGASGIGLATAQLAASRGAIVCIGDVDPAALQSTTAHLTALLATFTVTKLDVSKRSEVDGWIDTIVEKYGRLDGAVNCAGIVGKHHGIRAIAELEDEEWNKIIAVNLTGMMYCLRAELRKISEGGSIVNITSIQGVMGFAGSGAYVASKHGVIGLTRSAAKESGDRNVRVNAVAPGAIETPLLQKAREANPNEGKDNPTAIKRSGTAEEMANIIVFLLGPESSYVTGSVYGGDGGWDC